MGVQGQWCGPFPTALWAGLPPMPGKEALRTLMGLTGAEGLGSRPPGSPGSPLGRGSQPAGPHVLP